MRGKAPPSLKGETKGQNCVVHGELQLRFGQEFRILGQWRAGQASCFGYSHTNPPQNKKRQIGVQNLRFTNKQQERNVCVFSCDARASSEHASPMLDRMLRACHHSQPFAVKRPAHPPGR